MRCLIVVFIKKNWKGFSGGKVCFLKHYKGQEIRKVQKMFIYTFALGENFGQYMVLSKYSNLGIF